MKTLAALQACLIFAGWSNLGLIRPTWFSTAAAQSASVVEVLATRPAKAYVILRTVAESAKEPYASLVLYGCPPKAVPQGVEGLFVSKMQEAAAAIKADAILIMRSESSCRKTVNPFVPTDRTFSGALYSYYLEADLIEFVSEDRAERRVKLAEQTPPERQQILQEMYQQTRLDSDASAEWGKRSFTLEEFQWSARFLQRSNSTVHMPHLIAALVRSGAEKNAEKYLKDLPNTLKKQPTARPTVIQALEELATGLPQKWNMQFAQAVSRIQQLK